MDGVIVAEGTREGQEHGLGHGAAGQNEALAEAKVLEPTLFRHHSVLCWIERGHTAPEVCIFAISSAL